MMMLLTLPPEMRDRIYEHVLVDDLAAFATATGARPPALLDVCRTLRAEYADVLFRPDVLLVEEYFAATHAWRPVRDVDAQIAILRRARIRDRFTQRGRASAQRFVARRKLAPEHGRQGMLTLSMPPRWHGCWMWSLSGTSPAGF